eukprot:scaffold59450_cov57-Phaeocystis_antarctica.AAC.2
MKASGGWGFAAACVACGATLWLICSRIAWSRRRALSRSAATSSTCSTAYISGQPSMWLDTKAMSSSAVRRAGSSDATRTASRIASRLELAIGALGAAGGDGSCSSSAHSGSEARGGSVRGGSEARGASAGCCCCLADLATPRPCAWPLPAPRPLPWAGGCTGA